MLSEYGQICFQYLKVKAVGKKARLRIPQKRVDNRGRLLGTVFLKGDDGQYSLDLGLDLVRKGYTLVYTEFEFALMSDYLAVENEAKQENAGFWSNERIRARAASLKLLWEEQKKND